MFTHPIPAYNFKSARKPVNPSLIDLNTKHLTGKRVHHLRTEVLVLAGNQHILSKELECSCAELDF